MIRPIDQIPELFFFFIVLSPEDLSPSHPPPIRPSLPRRLAHPVQLEPGSGGTMDDRGDIVLENHEETAIDSIIIRVNDDNDDGGQVGQKDNRDEVISPDDNDIATIKLKQFQLNENIDDDNPSSLELSVVPDNALRLYNKTGESSYEVLTPQDYVIENIEQLAGEKLGDVLSGPVTLYAEALGVPAGQLPPEVTLKWCYREKASRIYGLSDQLKIQVRWAVYPTTVLISPDQCSAFPTKYQKLEKNTPLDHSLEYYFAACAESPECKVEDLEAMLNDPNNPIGFLYINCHGPDPATSSGTPMLFFELFFDLQEAQNRKIQLRARYDVPAIGLWGNDGKYYIGLTPWFFQHFCPNINVDLVWLEACYSFALGNNSIAAAIYNSGAKGVIGHFDQAQNAHEGDVIFPCFFGIPDANYFLSRGKEVIDDRLCCFDNGSAYDPHYEGTTDLGNFVFSAHGESGVETTSGLTWTNPCPPTPTPQP